MEKSSEHNSLQNASFDAEVSQTNPESENKPCLVCWGVVSVSKGINACEACKAFFKRSIREKAIYYCKSDNCEVNTNTWMNCRECLFQKCVKIGMRRQDKERRYKKTNCLHEIQKQVESNKEGISSINGSEEKACPVCGEEKVRYSFGIFACCACIVFFHTHINQHRFYTCENDNHCEITKYSRKNCTACRFRKCFAVGMRPKYISRCSQKEAEPPSKPNSIEHLIEKLSQEQFNVLSQLVFLQEECESPSKEDLEKITPFSLDDTEEDSVKRLKHFTEITILTIQLIIQFSKSVPEFDELSQDDQIILVKANSSEIMMLRATRKYHEITDSIVFANDHPYTLENYHSTTMGDFADSIFRFCRKMNNLRLNNAQYVLLTISVLFSATPALQNKECVSMTQFYYYDTLISSMKGDWTQQDCEKILGIIFADLRKLSKKNLDLCVALNAQNIKLPPLLKEIWNLEP